MDRTNGNMGWGGGSGADRGQHLLRALPQRPRTYKRSQISAKMSGTPGKYDISIAVK